MIALRGTICHKETRRSPCPSPTTSSTISPTNGTKSIADTNTDTTTTEFDPKSAKPGEWIWSGYWAYGSLPPDDVLDGTVRGQHHHHNQKKKKPPSGVRPFIYKFQRVKDAKDVIVPSSLLSSNDDHVDGGDSDNDENQKEKQQQQQLQISGDNETTTKSNREDSTKDEDSERINRSNKDEEQKTRNTTMNELELYQGEEKKELDEHHDIKQEIHEYSKDLNSTTSAIDLKDLKNSLVGDTFATMSDGDKFTDAGETNPKTCPIGGCWKGYFENVSKRKDRMSSRVQEEFHLFFNATPPSDAKSRFLDEDDDGNDTDDSGNLPLGHIHVRGAGTNKFGTFEILGGYDIETGILSCQRIYVSTSDEGNHDKNHVDTKEKTKVAGGSPSRKTVVKKTYFTRKRPVASWRTSSYGAYDEMFDNGTGRTPSGRKRQRTVSEPSLRSSSFVEDESSVSQTVSSAATNEVNAKKRIGGTSTSPKSMSKTKDNETSTNNTSNTTTTNVRRQSPKFQSHRKQKISPSSTRPSPSTNSSAYQIKLPKVGNPVDAKWRAAHFIYFQRYTDNNDSLSSGATDYVVYEGEMNYGRNLRDGRGVCLYSNGTLYEGDWKKNKEHGNGILLTGDRKRIIYSGEWERGKMHGRGTYYYHMYASAEEESDSKNGGMYVGDFKENARHGVGTYSLPGGDVYSGDWRENVPCGKGTFRWSEGSEFDGMWKDGRRNGWGKLTCSDGFSYEGNWKDNAMEGRGTAIYPNGQQYDGMWLDGKRDGRGTIIFGNGAVYKGRFKEDVIEGQGTLKVDRNVAVTRVPSKHENSSIEEPKHSDGDDGDTREETIKTVIVKGTEEVSEDWMIPLEFQSDIGRIHQKAGFTTGGE